MKNKSNTSSIELNEFLTINTQEYVQAAHKLRGEAIASHFGIMKNMFKRKSTQSKLNK